MVYLPYSCPVFLYANSFANIPLLVLVVGKFIREQNRIMVSLKSFLVDVAFQCFTFSVVNPNFMCFIALRIHSVTTIKITSKLCNAIDLYEITFFKALESSNYVYRTMI